MSVSALMSIVVRNFLGSIRANEKRIRFYVILFIFLINYT